jgi:hypothetical protein
MAHMESGMSRASEMLRDRGMLRDLGMSRERASQFSRFATGIYYRRSDVENSQHLYDFEPGCRKFAYNDTYYKPNGLA